jgi:choline dehydrogenase-like flavoprotein
MASVDTAAAPAAFERITTERAERRLAIALRVLAGVLLVGAVVYALGPLVGPAQEFFREPPFVTNSAVKVTAIALACLYAAGDVRRRGALVLIVIAAHLVSIIAMASMLLFADTGHSVDLGFAEPTLSTVLWAAMALDGAIAVVLGALALPAGLARNQPDAAVLTPVERRTRTLLIVFAVVFALGAVAYLVGPLLSGGEAFFRELPFVTNSVVKVSMLAMLCGYVASSLRRNLPLVTPIVAVHVLSALVSALYLALLETGFTVPLFGGDVRMTGVLWGALALDGAIAVVLVLVARSAWKARFGPKFFGPAQVRALVAVADVLVAGEHERVPPEDVARNVDRQVAEIRAKRRWIYKACLAGMQARPLLDLLPPLSELEPRARRRFLTRRFQTPPLWPPILKHLTQIMIRICQQLSFVGYYGDRRSFESIGYKPFTERERFARLTAPEPGPHPLKVDRPENIGVKELEADICIIGSGAAGGILAYELARAHPDCRILVLERGEYVEPRHFTEDEVGMIGRLYADGLMQQTEDWRFTVLQGSCVGGSTTVNNAVCFDPPQRVLDHWNNPHGHDAGLHLDCLRDSVAAVRSFLTVVPQIDAVLNPSGAKYLEGAGRLPAGALDVGVVQANIQGCFGSGYCNIGCKWGKKLSMLETALPWAQRDFADRVRIVADCEVERIVTMSGRPKRVAGLRAKLADGRGINIRARKYVVSAGSVASSYLLLRSGAGRGLPVGRGFSCNMGAPLTADFDGKPLNSYDGLQISHFGIPSEPGFVFETWFNPPVSQALNLPGWFEQHFKNMQRYDHLMAVGVLVGTASNGRIVRALTGGPGVDFRPQPKDLATLARGLKLLGELLFDAGAARVMVNSWGYDEFTSADQLGEIDRIAADPDHISLGTGHPQGGNAISRDPGRGVVGPDFKVHGYDDLYVCDASVFPSSLTVNPQLTVMSLAHYAAQRIAL